MDPPAPVTRMVSCGSCIMILRLPVLQAGAAAARHGAESHMVSPTVPGGNRLESRVPDLVSVVVLVRLLFLFLREFRRDFLDRADPRHPLGGHCAAKRREALVVEGLEPPARVAELAVEQREDLALGLRGRKVGVAR